MSKIVLHWREIPLNQQVVLFMLALSTKNTTVCTGFMIYGGQTACFMDSNNIDTSGWVRFVDPYNERGGSQSVHTNVFAEAKENYSGNPLVEKANSMKCINISCIRV